MKKHYVLPTSEIVPQVRHHLMKLGDYGIDQMMLVDNALKNVVTSGNDQYSYDELLEYLQSVLCQMFETDDVKSANTQTVQAIEDISDTMVDVLVTAVDDYIEKIKPYIFKIEEDVVSSGIQPSHITWEVDSCIGDDIVIAVSDGDPSAEIEHSSGRTR